MKSCVNLLPQLSDISRPWVYAQFSHTSPGLFFALQNQTLKGTPHERKKITRSLLRIILGTVSHRKRLWKPVSDGCSNRAHLDSFKQGIDLEKRRRGNRKTEFKRSLGLKDSNRIKPPALESLTLPKKGFRSFATCRSSLIAQAPIAPFVRSGRMGIPLYRGPWRQPHPYGLSKGVGWGG